MPDQYLNTPANSPGFFIGADPDWQLKQQQVAAADTFKNGLPTDAAGNVDYTAAAKQLLQKGAFAPASQLLSAGISQQQMRDAAQMQSGMSKWLTPGAGAAPDPAAQPTAMPAAPSTRGANPEVVSYVRDGAIARKINPNVALGVVASEGLRGFDPNGKPNLGDDGSSAGPFQLHYGGVAGGPNAAPGLGDDFTKVTGLDARDPSTWKQQVDFSLDHAAKNGWGAWHGATKAGIGTWAGIDRGPAQSAQAGGLPQPMSSTDSRTSSATPVAGQVDQDEKPPSNVHPFAPSAPVVPPAISPPGGTPASLPSQAQGGQPSIAPGQVAGPGAPTSSAPLPSTLAPPPPLSPTAGAVPKPLDPTFGGQVPAAWLAAGHTAGEWVNYARAMAGLAGANPFAKAAGEQWTKIADGLASSIDKALAFTPEQKNARDALAIEYEQRRANTNAQARIDAQNSPIAIRGAGQKASAQANAKADIENQNTLVPIARPDGSMTLVPKSVALAQATDGKTVTSSLPGYVTSGQQNLATKLNDGTSAYAERQVAGERLDALSNLLSTYQTGANSAAFNDAAAKLKSFGINVPNSATINPAAMQQFTKDAYANVLSSMREQGNKQFVSEVQSAVNSNPNTDLQPEANAAMIAQMRGIQTYHDKNFQDYADWYNGNKGASNDAKFQIDWAKANPVGTYITAARKEIAPLGAPMPPKAQLVDGQAYMIRGQKARWNSGAGMFVPVGK